MRTLTLAAGVLLWLAQPPAVGILDETFADYLEDEQANRILAGIQVQLRRTRGETRVRVTASAESPNVDPVPGYRGLRGASGRTRWIRRIHRKTAIWHDLATPTATPAPADCG